MQKPSAIDIDPVIYLAIELSASTWLVVSKIPASEKTGLHRDARRYGQPDDPGAAPDPGTGGNFAAVLTREVFTRPFENRRQIASYPGLAKPPFQSGGMDRDRRISRAFNARARKTLIQLAWLWLRDQPDSSLAYWFRERAGNLQGRTRRIAIAAMARKLLIAIWRYATGFCKSGIPDLPVYWHRSGGGANLDLIRNRRYSAGGCPGRCDRLPHWELTHWELMLPAFQVGHIQPGPAPHA